MNFTCRKLKCENNIDCVCKLNKININENLKCENYSPSDKYVEDKTKTMFDKTPQFEAFKHHKEVCINCKADCIFNCKSECMANGIIVNQSKNDSAKCVTFLKK